MTNDLLSIVATAIDAEMARQYEQGQEWEEAKDVLECLDYCEVARVAIEAMAIWEKKP
jgi:hypothetical protein